MAKELWQTLGPHVDTYELAVTNIVPVDSKRVQLKGRQGRFEAVLASVNEAAVKRTAGDLLAHQGQRLVQRHLKNVYQERARRVNEGRVMYVSNVFEGRPLQVTPYDVLQAGENLGLLHTALAEGRAELQPYRNVMHNRLGSWIESLKSAQELFVTERTFARDRVRRQDTKAWSDLVDSWIDVSGRAVELLEKQGYNEWSASKPGGIAWNGYRLSSLLRLPDGRMAVNQVSAPVRDTPLYDLASLCLDVSESGHVDGVMEAMDAYALHQPIDEDEKTMVLAFVAFPHQGLRMLHGVRTGRVNLSSDSAWKRRMEQQKSVSNRLLDKTRG
ncbi:hypothetical protein [Alicyclobacillus sp. SO9]|uniref:hypothetical protein n=1 Tax=Alicyclobacillus sp. SO9 TaxID=2665646 RepID=UPI0018E8ACE7|nr:hypothetical protein [Alicyclobacillus sp. SO9]QQE77020.1 hypothetical protein GI364_13610 [Alicyclobacillus sp. SO9]